MGDPGITPNRPHEEPQTDHRSPPWRPVARALFRFVFCYFGLYALLCLSIVFEVLLRDFSKGKVLVQLMEFTSRGFVQFAGRHLLGIREPIEAGTTDSLFEFVQNGLFLGCAMLGALLWSILDRKQSEYRKLREWLMLVMRFTLAAIMFLYGFYKVFPLQFNSITRLDLMQPLGYLNHYNILWRFMAASKPYTIFSGSLEVLGGILLLIPRLAGLGALLCVVVIGNVFALNVAYNVDVKLLSLNLLLIALFLASQEFPRLLNLLVFNRPVSPQRPVPLANGRGIDKGARILQAVLGACVFVVCLYSCWARYAEREKAEATAVPLQGLWLVDEFVVSGEPQHSLFTPKLASDLHLAQGEDRWAMLVFETPGLVVIQTRNGVMDYVNLDLNRAATTAALSDSGDDQWKGQLRFESPQKDRLNLTGEVNGVTVDAKLHRMDESRFILQNESINLIDY